MTTVTKKDQTLTASAAASARTPSLLAHMEAKRAKQAERSRLREDRMILRAVR
mgnify:CR=1 FL=1